MKLAAAELLGAWENTFARRGESPIDSVDPMVSHPTSQNTTLVLQISCAPQYQWMAWLPPRRFH